VDKRRAELNKYAVRICKEIGVKPEDDVFKNSVFSKEGLILPFRHLIFSAFAANWDPVYNADALKIITNKSKFIKFFETGDLSSGAPPDSLVVNYLNLAKEYFKHGLLISNFSHASYIEDKIKSVSNQNSPVIIYGGPGVFKYSVAKIIHHSSKRSKAPFEAVDCSHYNDHQLCSVVFGTVNANSHNDCRGKIASADKGTLYIKNLHDSGKYFQGKLYKLINENVYSKEDSTDIEKSNIRIICSRELRDEDYTDYPPQIDINLFYTLFTDHINLPDFSFVRSNIPLLIYLSIEKAKRKYGAPKNMNQIEIPYYLIKYWLTEEEWEDNFLQIQYSCDYYLREYLKYYKNRKKHKSVSLYRAKTLHSTDHGIYYFHFGKNEDKHRKMLEFFNMSDSPKIFSYLNSTNTDPFFTIRHDDLLYYPFLSFALFTYKAGALKPEVEYSAYQNLSPFQKEYYFENKWFPRRSLTIKTGQPDFNMQLKSTLDGSKTDMPNIKKIIAVIDKKNSKFLDLSVIPINQSKPIPLKISPKRRAGLSLLVFLIYEKSKILKKIETKYVIWDQDWFGNPGEEKFPPFEDVCKWFGYDKNDWGKNRPGWWFRKQYVTSTITKLAPLLEENNIVPNIITIKQRMGDFNIYQLHKDLEAEIIMK